MKHWLPIVLSALLSLSACATSTPIARPTPTYHVPAVSAEQRAKEAAALQAAETSLEGWQKLVTSLPQASAN